MNRVSTALRILGPIASLAMILIGATATWAQTEDVRGENRDLQHEQMVGSEAGSNAPDTERGEVELSHEEMQSTDHERHIEAPPPGRTQTEQ